MPDTAQDSDKRVGTRMRIPRHSPPLGATRRSRPTPRAGPSDLYCPQDPSAWKLGSKPSRRSPGLPGDIRRATTSSDRHSATWTTTRTVRKVPRHG